MYLESDILKRIQKYVSKFKNSDGVDFYIRSLTNSRSKTVFEKKTEKMSVFRFQIAF